MMTAAQELPINMKFRIVCSGDDDVKNGMAVHLCGLLTSMEPEPAFSGILSINGIADISNACTFLESDFDGITIFILDSELMSLTQNRKAFKLFTKITEFLSPCHRGHILLINHRVSMDDMEDFKKDFGLSDNFEQALVHHSSLELRDIADHAYRLMSHPGPTESEELTSSGEGLNSYDRRPMEHHCSMSSGDSMNGTRMPPLGDSAPVSLKGQSRSVPMSRKASQDPIEFRSDPARLPVTGYNPGHVTGYNPGPVTGYSPSPVAGYNPCPVTGYNPGPVTGYNPGPVTGHNPGPMTGFNPGPVNGYNPSQLTGEILPQRVPEQNQQSSFFSEDMFVSNYREQFEENMQNVPCHDTMLMSPGDSGNYCRGLAGLNFLMEEPLSPPPNSDIVSSYVQGDMDHLLEDIGENALSKSMFDTNCQGQVLPSGSGLDCKKDSLASVPSSATGCNDYYTDESVSLFPTYGPAALNVISADCVQKKSDSIPSMESSTVNSMIMSGVSGKLNDSGNSFRGHQHEKSLQSQRSQQKQGSFQGQGFQRQMQQQSEDLNQKKMPQEGRELNQSRMLQGQRSLNELNSQGQMVNQMQRSQGQMSVQERLSQDQNSSGQLAVQIQMNQIVTGMSNIKFKEPTTIASSKTEEQIKELLQAYTNRNPNQAMATNLDRQMMPTMVTISANQGRQAIPRNLQNQTRQGKLSMPSIQKNLVPKGDQQTGNMYRMPNVYELRMAAPNRTTMPQRMTSSPQGLTLLQGMTSPCQGMASPQGMTFPPQGIASSQGMTSPPQGMSSPQSMPAMQETEMNLLSRNTGLSTGPRSLPDNVQSQTAGYLKPNIRCGDVDNHSSMQSETGNRLADDQWNGTNNLSQQERETRTNAMGNSSNRRGRDDGASGGIAPEPINDAMGAENQVDIHELPHPVFVYIQNQLDCSQMYDWKDLAHLHGLNYRQIQEIEQLWKHQRINSPFEYLIRTFQRYSVQQLRDDLRKIPRFDILDRLKKMEMDGKLPPSCAGLFTQPP